MTMIRNTPKYTEDEFKYLTIGEKNYVVFIEDKNNDSDNKNHGKRGKIRNLGEQLTKKFDEIKKPGNEEEYRFYYKFSVNNISYIIMQYKAYEAVLDCIKYPSKIELPTVSEKDNIDEETKSLILNKLKNYTLPSRHKYREAMLAHLAQLKNETNDPIKKSSYPRKHTIEIDKSNDEKKIKKENPSSTIENWSKMLDVNQWLENFQIHEYVDTIKTSKKFTNIEIEIITIHENFDFANLKKLVKPTVYVLPYISSQHGGLEPLCSFIKNLPTVTLDLLKGIISTPNVHENHFVGFYIDLTTLNFLYVNTIESTTYKPYDHKICDIIETNLSLRFPEKTAEIKRHEMISNIQNKRNTDCGPLQLVFIKITLDSLNKGEDFSSLLERCEEKIRFKAMTEQEMRVKQYNFMIQFYQSQISLPPQDRQLVNTLFYKKPYPNQAETMIDRINHLNTDKIQIIYLPSHISNSFFYKSNLITILPILGNLDFEKEWAKENGTFIFLNLMQPLITALVKFKESGEPFLDLRTSILININNPYIPCDLKLTNLN